MTDSKKSFIKSTLLGILGGGLASAVYSLNSQSQKADPGKDEIVVPLSRRNFMKSVRSVKNDDTPKKEKAKVKAEDVSAMSPRDLAALKKAIIGKSAEAKCSKVESTESVEKGEYPVRRITGAGSTFPRDEKGRFVSEKDAGIFSDAKSTIADSVGILGGTAVGLAAVKLVSDRILLNKKKRQVEESRKRYVDALAREVNDVDAPYYSKTASDRGLIGSTLGLLGMSGLVAGTAAGIVMYRIMENRRKQLEKEKDKDLASYPVEKTIRFSFPKEGAARSGFFA